ncbi:SAG family member [Eimeria necatrix]|uniref:SAG family member n=1 Tax=Eimeria necatrix TaxID=51315 RepID=U6MGL8_9EIME|nr:SAG family member [Eimeria necatrix]CDJ63161.1 SAG family member [Eimeria necatrix]
MLCLAFLSLFVVLGFCGDRTESATTTGKAETLDCLTQMNEARAAAGLPGFGETAEEGKTLPEYADSGRAITPETLWKQVCQKIMGDEGAVTEIEKLSGTPAYYPGSKDCAAAVQYWKEGFSLFNNKLPPTYQEIDDPDVYTDRAVSFVALYNPQVNPVASCAFVTCTKAAASADQDLSRSPDGHSLRRLQAAPQITTAVICLTNPVALKAGVAPFKEEEWQKIVRAIVGTEEVNRVSAVTPSLTLGFIMLFAYSLF